MTTFPLLTGVLTIIMFSGVGWVLWTEGQMVWAGLSFLFAAIRLILFAGQIVRLLQRRRHAAEDARAAEDPGAAMSADVDAS
ncbi:MAG: hypothetical protein AB8H79_11435 [Myxococcota bacterium]